MKAAPSFTLPACPRCSSPESVVRPFWRFAQNTSRARGHACHIFTGCPHADELGRFRIVDDAEGWLAAEARWQEVADAAFAEVTARWAELPRARFRAALDERAHLPGATDPLPLEDAEARPGGPVRAVLNPRTGEAEVDHL